MLLLIMLFGLMFFPDENITEETTPPTIANPQLEGDIGKYNFILTYVQAKSKVVLDLNSYQNLELKSRTTDKIINFKDFSPLEQRLFLIIQAEGLSDELKLIEIKLKEESLKEPELDYYIFEVHKIRREFANAFEHFIVDTFNKFSKEINAEERKHYLEQVKKAHDEDRLIDR